VPVLTVLLGVLMARNGAGRGSGGVGDAQAADNGDQGRHGERARPLS
jgi:hypothetical protein